VEGESERKSLTRDLIPPAELRKIPGKRSQLTCGVKRRQSRPAVIVTVISVLLISRPFLSMMNPNTSAMQFIEKPSIVPAVLKITPSHCS
jgi:hypothetical protein